MAYNNILHPSQPCPPFDSTFFHHHRPSSFLSFFPSLSHPPRPLRVSFFSFPIPSCSSSFSSLSSQYTPFLAFPRPTPLDFLSYPPSIYFSLSPLPYLLSHTIQRCSSAVLPAHHPSEHFPEPAWDRTPFFLFFFFFSFSLFLSFFPSLPLPHTYIDILLPFILSSTFPPPTSILDRPSGSDTPPSDHLFSLLSCGDTEFLLPPYISVLQPNKSFLLPRRTFLSPFYTSPRTYQAGHPDPSQPFSLLCIINPYIYTGTNHDERDERPRRHRQQ
ncbi:MAG: hypothetical protein J3R72DRAFT_86746 [Linnemannia gamsii]|nr:MAG: hypothetical protein J3R72DRAFT_86746 [Linnemannia gamsii]